MSCTPLPSTPANEPTSHFQPPSTQGVHVDGRSVDNASPDNAEENSNEHQAETEASDYWNDGKTHDTISPLMPADRIERDKPLPSLPLGERNDVGISEESNVAEFPTGNRGSTALGTGRSVQFAEKGSMAPVPSSPSHTRHGSWDGLDSPSRHMASSLMSRIKALSPGMKSLALPGLSPEHASQSGANSPSTSKLGNRLPGTLVEDSAERSDTDADADIETADEATVSGNPSANKKKKRRMRRFAKGHASSPSTASRLAGSVDTEAAYNRLLRRRASMPDTSAATAGPDHGLSEGEAHSHFRRRPFRRGHSYVGTTTPSQGDDVADMESSAVIGRRTGHLRRITVFGGGGVSDGDALTPRRPFFNSERASNYGAQKWKQVKSTLKLLRQKKEDRFDYLKSAELMAELRAGAPAALMLASMIQRDEHGNKRIPVLLEQLKLRITDSSPVPDDDKDRHWHFTMELEYGSGPSRMSWTVIRTVRDIYNLHFRYRFALNNEKYMLGRDLSARPKQPKFPYSAFPYLRRARDKGDESDDDEQYETGHEDTAGEPTIPEEADGALSGGEGRRGPVRKKSMGNLWGMRRRSTGFTDADEMSNTEGPSTPAVDMATRRQRYVEKQRRILEKYLSEMIRWLMFRADSNRLCRFLELSALGVRLAAEGSYHGKEGYLHIQTSKGLDFRRVMTPAKVIARHSRKWFLVRQSYIVCVQSPENMNIYDVYLVDNKFSIISKKNALKQITAKDKRKEIDLTTESPLDKHHTLTLHTSERKVRLFSRNQSVMKQFEDSINEMLRRSAWYEKKTIRQLCTCANRRICAVAGGRSRLHVERVPRHKYGKGCYLHPRLVAESRVVHEATGLHQPEVEARPLTAEESPRRRQDIRHHIQKRRGGCTHRFPSTPNFHCLTCTRISLSKGRRISSRRTNFSSLTTRRSASSITMSPFLAGLISVSAVGTVHSTLSSTTSLLDSKSRRNQKTPSTANYLQERTTLTRECKTSSVSMNHTKKCTTGAKCPGCLGTMWACRWSDSQPETSRDILCRGGITYAVDESRLALYHSCYLLPMQSLRSSKPSVLQAPAKCKCCAQHLRGRLALNIRSTASRMRT